MMAGAIMKTTSKKLISKPVEPANKKKRAPRNPSRSVQISLKQDLLRQVDAEPEVKKEGRSAFIAQAILLLLRVKREKLIDDQIRAAYEGHAEEILAEAMPLIESQVWPPDDDLVEYGDRQ